MRRRKKYNIYIFTNKNNTVLYVGVTSNLLKRCGEHRTGHYSNSFTKKYNLSKLVYYEDFDDISYAIAREKQIKGGSRQDKIDLINKMNSKWCDLYNELNPF